jgi:uncharacterized protein
MMAVRDQVMSSTERAPEPTMEEILASIRRIISDDESSSARQHTAAPQSQEDDEVLELSEGEADDKIINDIARVLSGGAPAPVEAVEEEEDILDLTAELGELEPVEEMQAVEVVAEAEEPAPEPVFEPAPEPEPEEESPQLEAEAPEPEAEAKPAEAPQPQSASEEAASALERAIAALRAGQLPTSPIFSYEPSPLSQPEPLAPSAPAFMPEPPPAPEQALAPEPAFEQELEPERELVLTEFEAEMVAEEPAIFDVVVAEPEPAELPAWGGEAPSWREPEEREAEPELPTNGVNGGNHQTYGASSGGKGSAKTLEDSIKDMLRPMLQQWLEENMTRVLTAALKDEIKGDPSRFQGD